MTKDEILSRLLSDISDEFDKGVGSFFYDVTKPTSEEFETAYARLEEILKNGFALTASGEYLDFKAAEQGITRKSGIASKVVVTITGTPGSIISVGDKVASDNLIFSAIENKEISESGTEEVTVVCDTVGTVGNIPTGSINRFPVTLSGIVSVTNNEPATGGFDEETDDELRDRYFEKVSLPATSGSKYHYIQWAKEINGVGDAKCFPLWNGNGTVKVIIINADMATVNFTYDYPYAGYGEDGRFQAQWSESRKTLNGCYTYPMVFNTAVPQCKHIKMNVEIENTGSGTVLGRSWDFFVYRQSYGWYEVCSFTLPDDGKYTIDTDISNYTITQIACVPSSNPGSSRTWSTWYDIEQLTITETVTVNELTTGTFQYGVFANYYGLEQKLTEVYVNIDGTLKQATDVLVNIDGALVSLPQVQSAYLKTTSDFMTLYGFTPSLSGTYRITQKKISGDHEIRLYGSDFTQLYDGYFYDRSFDLVAGTLYYITVTHYRGADTSESYLQIFKEA